MSNNLVGTIYKTVINDVIDSSRVDFDESGVDAALLDGLRDVWQQKLSSLKLAKFPWDPAEEPAQQAPIGNPPTLPSNAGRSGQPQASTAPAQPQSSGSTPTTGAPSTSAGYGSSDVQVKREPGAGPPSSHFPTMNDHSISNSLSNPQIAANRAAQLMQEKFGPKANTQVGNIQSGLLMPGQRPGPQHAGQGFNQQQAQRQQQSVDRNGQGPPQTDGPGEDPNSQWAGIMKVRNDANGDDMTGTIEIDNQLRRYIEERGVAMEGGGLMVTLDEYNADRKGKKRKLDDLHLTSSDPVAANASALKPASMKQMDGGDESDEDNKDNIELFEDSAELDEDAITSDLDDPADDAYDDADDGESAGHMMLCTYEKVQRVKNKWKCTLKDGVLTVNGRDYVFHKGTGEYEW